jgi:starch synthase (maltosyl-transferring)
VPRKRLLFVSTSLGLGGAERAIARLAMGLRGRFEIEAASLLPVRDGVAGELCAAGVALHDLGARSKTAAPLVLGRLAALCARFDLVSSFLFHANVLARLARPRRLVVSIRYADLARPWRLRIERALAPLADRIVCVSESVRRAARFSPRDSRVLVIPNGVPIPAAPAPLAPGAPWISVGRLDAQKGFDVLIEAWRVLASGALCINASRPFGGLLPPRLLVAGAGPLEPALRARAQGLPIEFLGERRDIPELFAGAAGFVLASREEGLPNALLEAMAAGLPAVATAVGGVAEALAPGTGVLVPAGDPLALARAVAEIAADPPRARALGAAGRARVQDRFALERMVSAWAALYDDVLERC